MWSEGQWEVLKFNGETDRHTDTHTDNKYNLQSKTTLNNPKQSKTIESNIKNPKNLKQPKTI